jgi:CheY-like chemotaxis protein
MKYTVLLVEENDRTREKIAKCLTIEGYEVLEANCGAEAITIAGKQIPSLIVCDVSMKQMNGYELFLSLFRSIYYYKIPFIYFVEDKETELANVLSIENYAASRFWEPGLINYIKKVLPIENKLTG